jgi:hypothetical protein
MLWAASGAWTNSNGWLSGALFGAISDFQVRVDEAHVVGEQHRRAGLGKHPVVRAIERHRTLNEGAAPLWIIFLQHLRWRPGRRHHAVRRMQILRNVRA